jgi:hypothetical protein
MILHAPSVFLETFWKTPQIQHKERHEDVERWQVVSCTTHVVDIRHTTCFMNDAIAWLYHYNVFSAVAGDHNPGLREPWERCFCPGNTTLE